MYCTYCFRFTARSKKKVVLLIDEIYVKPSLCYHGGKVFGKAQNNPEELTTTVLAIMVKCLFGGSEFILKMIPVYRLTASFQYDQVMLIIDQLEQCGAKIVAVICDGNQVNKDPPKHSTQHYSITASKGNLYMLGQSDSHLISLQ